MKKIKLLVNYVYWQNVGHAIEALRYTLGYYKANPSLEVSLILNEHTPYELAYLCSWIKNVYLVNLPDEEIKVTKNLYRHIPTSWDYVVSDHRSQTKEWCPGAFYEYYQQMNQYLVVKYSRGLCGDNSVPYKPNQQLKLDLPEKNLCWAKRQMINTKINVGFLFAGHKERKYFPSMKSWQAIISAFYERYGENLSVYFFGKLKRKAHRTLTSVSRKDIDNLLEKYPRSVDCFDVGFLNQLAVAKNLDVFISPHSGFSFAVLVVGTPWLTISGGRWSEYFYNGVPFYSVLPDRKKYPVYEDKNFNKTVKEEEGRKILSMSYQRIIEDLPEILHGADILIDKKWGYERCLKNHFKKLTKFYDDPKQIWSFDGIHTEFIK